MNRNKILVSDADDDSFLFSIVDGVWSDNKSVMEGVYGTLSINTNTGEWTNDPNENNKVANGRASDKFQLNISDGVTNVTSSFKVDVAVGIKGNGTSDNDHILVDNINLNLDGGDGIDAVLYQNTSDEYSLKVENSVVTVSNGGD